MTPNSFYTAANVYVFVAEAVAVLVLLLLCVIDKRILVLYCYESSRIFIQR